MTPVYLDNAATTQVVPEVADVVLGCMREDFGNPSSAHHMGIEADRRIKAARDELGAAIGDRHGTLGQILWTSGGTESDALGVLGAARSLDKRGTRMALTAIEHSAVRESAQALAQEGFSVATVPVTRAGVVDVAAVLEAMTDDTTVVAVMLVNNEIGTIQPVAEVARAVKQRVPHVHVHCDAVQALGKVAVDVTALGVDSLALAAHKLHGPKGVGALWLRAGVRIAPLWGGGGQQGGLRSGTHNVPGIAGMGEATRLAMSGLAERQARWRAMGQTLEHAAGRAGVAVRVNGAGAPRAPHIVSISFAGVPAEPLLHVLESRGVLVSAGSACAERQRKPSPVLQAIGVGPTEGTIRFSFGRTTTPDEVDRAAEILIDAVRSF